MWYGRALCSIKLPSQHCHFCFLKACGIDLCKSGQANKIKGNACRDICFVHYFKILRDRKMKMHEIYLMLHCIRLRWQRTEKNARAISPARVCFSLLNSIKKSAQVLRRNTMIALIHEREERARTHFEMFEGTKHWEIETFYVNRFFSNGVKEFDTATRDDTL